ncbi:centrosome and spindle pole-associated protein 1-like isoform X32 [Ostrea edulis]|uniref:centrosome and spindle pole-associated protein 1-like isoform X32 n=1 Tax=Ostrea edulis TaxID=37623 RepID=UPI0024AFF50B|nr:centrosome and spindle pole-associated protein 1-like isoform X32 [Ostrea edulis]XP_056018996.1 centrosome and spindle pole-associated protein 1-like isoform X32 [Ostrea edulis]
MAAAVENDIEEFIRNQKAKLQQERQYISHQKGGLRSSPRKPDMDYNETERQFQEQRRREYNEFLSRPKFKKAPTPPQSGMKFGEYEDFRKRVAQQRKEEYREELEKQTLEQAITKARGKLDISIPRNHQNPQAVSQEDVNRLSQEKQRRNIRDKMVEDKRIKEFERMLHMHHEDKLTDYMEEERNRILEDYPLREQDIQAMFQRQREEREKQKQNEEREREIQRKQFEFQRKLDDNYVRDSGDYGYQGRNAARSEPPVRRNDQYDAPRQQSEYVPPRRGDYSPPRQDYSPRRDENEGFTDRLHQRYEDERRQEYQNYVQKRNAQATNRSWNEPDDTESGLPLTNDFKHKQQMELERNQEYNEFMKKKYNKNKAPAMKQTGNNPSVGQYEDKKKRLQQERQREYREMMDKKEQDRGKGRRGEQPRNRSPDNFLSGLGKHQEEREKLNDERKKEYNHMLAEDLPRRDRPRDPPPEPEEPPPRSESYEASLHGLRSHESAEVRRKQTRNEEYNEFLKQKREQEKHRFDNKKYGENPRRVRDRPASEPQLKDGIYATLPGLHYNGSAERRKVETRNKEYNEFLRNSQENLSRRGGGGGNKPPAGARRGWQSPGYEENRKRREEAQYRRDEPQAERRIRAYASDGAINRAGNDRRSNGDERDYGRRGRHRSDRNRDKGILDDDNWLTNRGEPEDEYQDLIKRLRGETEESDPPRQRGGPPPNRSPPVDREEMAKANYFATLPVGANDRDSANARKKARYREELQLQMREAEAARRREKEREKVEELRVNASGLLDPEKTSRRLRYLGDPSPTPRRNVRSPEVKPYHTRFDLSPRGGQGNVPESSGGYTPRERGRPRERRQRDTSGILDIGFDGFLEQPRRGGASQIPPGLQYQPSLLDFTSLDRFADPSIEPTRTYVTGGGTGGVNQPYSSIDEAYHYYGMKNPLEPENNRKRNPYGAPPLDLGGGYDRPYQGRGTPRVTFDESSHKNSILKDDKRQKFEKKDEKIQTVDKKDETVQTIEITVPPPPTTARARDRSKERISPYQFPSDEDFRSRSQNDKRSYQEELDRQIEEKRRKKQLEKEEQLRYERKLDDEIRNYNPFGKGGGGAPLRDTKGNVVADLRGMHNTNQDPDTARSQVTRESPRFQAPTSPRDDLIGQPPPQIDAAGDVTHARGGHGIFGQPKTEQEKTTSDKYKDDLRRQIEEKKRREQIEKEKERMEEEKENRRLEEQRLRIQSEFEEEQRKKREKEDEARKRNEEMQQQAEARKKEAKRKKQEEDDQRMQEKREQENRERQERQEQRGSSPPVPALRTGDQKPDYSEAISNSSSSRQNHFRSESVRLGMGTPDSLGLKKPYGISTSEDTRKSPPIPALRRDTPPSESSKPPPQPLSRANSSDVLKELASMRKQLQSERKRVENALETQRNEPDVFDPRVVQRPPPKEIDVFERARQGEPAPVRADANPRNLQEFNELKYKNDTESRKAFRSMFPDAPTSNETLEAQQDALLRHQEDTLKSMKEQRFTPTNYNAWKGRRSDRSLGAPPMTTRQGTVSPRSMLNSNSAFIDVDGLNHFPDDFEDLPKRNESARYRRRERVALSPRVDSVGYNPPESQPLNPFGSTTSLDVDRIQRKNDARLRRLHNLNADEVSLADPDDILDRFMAKQRYNRPPSGQTLQDDTWLRPASKAI